MDELTKALKNVPDSYSDFISGVRSAIKSEEDKQKVIQYIHENPDAQTDDVIEYLSVELLHLLK